MANRKIFFSLHFEKDAMRVETLRKVGTLEANPPVAPKEWEQVKERGTAAIAQWIDETMHDRSCVVVLVGEDTANREWVNYEIRKAWDDGKGLLGIYVHNLEAPGAGKAKRGANPFDDFRLKDGTRLSNRVKCYDPDAADPSRDIAEHLEHWVEDAILPQS